MTSPKSTHLSEVAGAIEEITGSLIVDTGLRDVQSFTASFAQALTVATKEAILGWEFEPVVPGTTQKVLISTYLLAGTPGVEATKVSWTAIGK